MASVGRLFDDFSVLVAEICDESLFELLPQPYRDTARDLTNNYGEAFNLIPLALIILPFCFRNERFSNLAKDWRAKLSIAVLPLFWFAIYWLTLLVDLVTPDRSICDGPVDCALSFLPLGCLSVTAFVFLAYGLYRIYKNVGYRLITSVFFAANAYFALWMFVYVGMTLSPN